MISKSKGQEYKWISIKEVEPQSVCILDILHGIGKLKGLRNTYPVYKNPEDSDKWYILFTIIPLTEIVGRFKIINWMPFPEPKHE